MADTGSSKYIQRYEEVLEETSQSLFGTDRGLPYKLRREGNLGGTSSVTL